MNAPLVLGNATSALNERLAAAHSRADQIVGTASNALRNIGYPIVVIGLILLNFSVIQNIGRELPVLVSHVQSVEAMGAKLVVNDPEKYTIKIPAAVPARQHENVRAAIGRLGPLTFQRFLNIDQGTVSCVYSRPDPQMRKYVALDYEIEDIGLITLNDDAPALGKVREEALKAGDAGFPAIGLPASCYQMELTALGRDAKTTLVGFFSKSFDVRGELQ